MLTIYRAHRADALVAALGQVLSEPAGDPFEAELVCVPSKGVERWISQYLAGVLGVSPFPSAQRASDGVCAHVRFPSVRRLVAETLAAVTGMDPATDPWAPGKLLWSVLAVIDECETESWCASLGRHLGAVADAGAGESRESEHWEYVLAGGADRAQRRGRRVAVARKLANLFTRYGNARPELILGWLAGPGNGSGEDEGVPADLGWQAELFRRVRARVGTPSPAERLESACAKLRADPESVELPERLAIFGPTRLELTEIRVLDALAARRSVRLFLPHPSPAAWQRTADTMTDSADDPVLAGEFAESLGWRDEGASQVVDLANRNPLLGSLGRDSRELQLRLLTELHSPYEVVCLDDTLPAGLVGGDHLLGRLQRDIYDDRIPAEQTHVHGDSTVAVHACHGRMRQVEVLREVVLGLLADDPALELRDIVVMCPDIEAYAPLLSATFGLAEEFATELGVDAGQESSEGGALSHPGQRLRIRLADRSLRETNPVLGVIASLLDLADGRLRASSLVDLAARSPVRRRFRFTDDDLELITDWVGRAGVRWGLDGDARSAFSLGGIQANTWRSGLDRLLVGVAMDEEEQRLFSGVLPIDDVDSGDIALVGRLAALVEAVGATVIALQDWKSLPEWLTVLESALEALVEVSAADGWQVTQARMELADLAATSSDVVLSRPLSGSDLRALLEDRLRGRATRANFRTGSLTVCSMVPMRSVPHRAVILLGLDDGVFPRTQQLDGDDILARRPRIGERDPRSEDRQLLLDALMSAQDHFIAFFTGNDERSGSLRHPATPLAELIDVARQTDPEFSVTRHPLQPFAPENFAGNFAGDSTESSAGNSESTGSAPFSFDVSAARGAVALQRATIGGAAWAGGSGVAVPFLLESLEPVEQQVIELEKLRKFVERPVKALIRDRLGMGLVNLADDISDELPVEAGGLVEWQVGNRLLASALRGEDPMVARQAELARGSLPPGALGERAIEPITAKVALLQAASAEVRQGEPQVVDIAISLSDGTRVEGAVPGVYGHTLVRLEYSKLKPKHRIATWLDLLALCTAYPDQPWRSIVYGRGRDEVAWSRVGALGQELAHACLADLVDLYRIGQCSPLPVPMAAASRYAQARHRGQPVQAALAVAEQEWRIKGREDNDWGEYSEPEHQFIWPDGSFTSVLAEAPVPGEARGGLDEPSRFGVLARRLWHPLLMREELG